MVYHPSILMTKCSMMEDVKLKVFVVDKKEWNYIRGQTDIVRNRLFILYERSKIKLHATLKSDNPLDRPRYDFNRCLSWPSKLLQKLIDEKPLLSPAEDECSSIVNFPVVMAEEPYGVVKVYYPFQNVELKRQQASKNQRLTFAVEMFLSSWCQKRKVCSLFQHIDDNDLFESPLVLLNAEGKVHIQMKLNNNRSFAMISPWSVPLHQWVQLHVSQTNALTNVTVLYGKDFSESLTHSAMFHKPISYKDFEGYMVIGGTIFCNNVNGIISHAKFCRNKNVSPTKIGLPKRTDRLFDIFLGKYAMQEKYLRNVVRSRLRVFKSLNKKKKDMSVPYFLNIIQFKTSKHKHLSSNQCSLYSKPVLERLKPVDDIVQEMAESTSLADAVAKTSEQLYKLFFTEMEPSNSLRHLKKHVYLLKQSARLGYGLSHFLLYSVFKNGIGVPKNMNKARFHLLKGAHCGDVLCLKVLGYNYLHGLSGFPKNLDLSFYYYFNLAHKTQKDLLKHSESLTSVNMARLTDEKQMKEQLSEGDDLFQWIKHQATKGAFSAQRNMGRLLYWGQQGLQRNLNAAFEYYKKAAQGGDPTALYDYGVILLKGHGTEADAEKGVEVLKQAADHQNPGALNTLGWYYSTKEVNMTKAMEYFEQADKLGSVDAAYNIGHMYHTGKYPGKKRDVKMAFTKYYKSATGGHVEGSLQVSYFMATGIRGFLHRNPLMAVQWSQYISERNPTMGELVREGLQAYRKHSWSKALLIYITVAETGFEVAQFNTAFLCESNMDDLVSATIEEECAWKNWNTSASSVSPHPYALNKMGDYFYYGYNSTSDLNKAIDYYGQAAKLKFSQAVFNLASILEKHGDVIDMKILNGLSLPKEAFESPEDTIVHLYRKCSNGDSYETSMPCQIALARTQLILMWNRTDIRAKIITFVAITLTTALWIVISMKRKWSAAVVVDSSLNERRVTYVENGRPDSDRMPRDEPNNQDGEERGFELTGVES
ncbi:protein sel-1 homolog 3-like isoform X2 [Clavelina lepadiformis]